MRLELATQKDFDAIITFYDDVTERTPEMATYAREITGTVLHDTFPSDIESQFRHFL